MKTSTASAPGKLMILGDHSVVYGYPCIVTAIDMRVRVSVSLAAKDEIVAPQVTNTDLVTEALRLFRTTNGIEEHVQLETASEFSATTGLGSSSAVIVATLWALSDLFGVSYSLEELFTLSYQVVLHTVGVGSGFDIAAAVYGGTIYFDGDSKESVSLSFNTLPLVVGYSGEKANTADIVRAVKKRYEQEEKKYASLFTGLADHVQDAYIASTTNDIEGLGALFNESHAVLQTMEVSTKQLDHMVQAATDAGAYGAKLSGAGGGDCMIALIPEHRRSDVEQAIEQAGGEIISVMPNAEGVRIEP